jgi:rubredoxin
MARSGKEGESYRRQMLRRLEQIDSGPTPSEVTEAQKTIAQYRQKQAEARQAIPRLRAPLPHPDLCPQCWFIHGEESPLHAARHPDPDNFDMWECRVCGYSDEQEIR